MRNRTVPLLALAVALAICAPMLSGCELALVGPSHQTEMAEEPTVMDTGEQTLDHSEGPAAVAYDFVYAYCNSIEFTDPKDDSQFQQVEDWRGQVLAYVSTDVDAYYDMPSGPPRLSATTSCEVTSVDGGTVILKVSVIVAEGDTSKGWTEDAPREEYWYRVVVGEDGLVQSYNVSQG